ncbi:MAG: protein translocase subunit SecF [Chloroflexota bacterium]
MFYLVEKRRWFFLFSGLVLSLGVALIIYSTINTGSPFRLSIDFSGGSIYEFRFIEEGATESSIRDVFAGYGEGNVVIQRLGGTAADFRVLVPDAAAASDTVRETIAAQVEPDVSVSVGQPEREEVIYTFSFEDSGAAPDTDALRQFFVDEGLETVFVRPISEAEGNLWSVVGAAEENSEIVSVLEIISADEPLTYERLEGEVLSVAVADETISEADVAGALADAGVDVNFVQREPYRWSVRGGFEDQATNDAILASLEELAELDRSSLRISTVSETVGQEVTRAAFVAVALAAVVITGFIIIAFRQIPNAVRYGMCAIAAMVHDVMVVMGAMSLMGLIAGWEIDALFLTAVLTVVGFSVQDSIVVFDRIRENIPKHIGEPYETIVNRSIWETVHRSLATQLNAFFIMIAILLFGGETIKQFIAILFIGLLSGTYSSIFIAVPLLVSWEKGEIPFLKGDEMISRAAGEAA